MCRMEDVTVNIDRISFKKRGYITFTLDDKRIIMMPIDRYPEVKKLTMKERKKWEIIDGQYFSWLKITDIYSVTDLLTK